MDIALLLENIAGYKFDTLPADIGIEKGDVKKNQDLQNAILLSLFTDRHAASSDAVVGNYLGGWWGDEFLDDPMGSRLWLLNRTGAIQKNVNFAKIYCVEALQWLIKAGAVLSFDVVTELRTDGNGINISVSGNEPNGREFNYQYAYLWQQIEETI